MQEPGVRENGYFYTGVAATPEQEEQMQAAYGVPLMVIGGRLPPTFEIDLLRQEPCPALLRKQWPSEVED